MELFFWGGRFAPEQADGPNGFGGGISEWGEAGLGGTGCREPKNGLGRGCLSEERFDEREFEGLAEEGEDFAGFHHFRQLGGGFAGDEDEGAAFGLGFEAVEPLFERRAVGQIDVGDDDFDLVVRHLLDGLGACFGTGDIVSQAGDESGEVVQDADVVIDDENVCHKYSEI